jgi:hypothetical protein
VYWLIFESFLPNLKVVVNAIQTKFRKAENIGIINYNKQGESKDTGTLSIMKRANLLIFFVFSLVTALLPSRMTASEPSFWTVDSKAEILKGQARGVAIAEDGTISLAPRMNKILDTDQPYIWSSAVDSAGDIYLGTGNEGKIFKIDKNGKVSVFVDLEELIVTAIVVGKDDKIFAATSPDGKVYQIDKSGKAEIYFDPKQKYIWSLAILGDSSLAVATGEKARIYLVKKAGDDPEKTILFKTKESHIICLTTDKEGNLYAGTDPNGLVIRFSSESLKTNGKPFALLDSPLREIHDLSIAPDGSLYVLALSESVASQGIKPSQSSDQASPESEESTQSNPTDIAKPQKSKYDLSDSKSVVYKIAPDGSNKIIWNSSTIVGFSILATNEMILIGTSDKGRIYGITDDGKEILLSQTDEGQISTLKTDGNRVLATSSNQGKLYAIALKEKVLEGTYESSIFDAKVTASWGRIWWRSSGNIIIQTRSGNTEKPDETWGDWVDGINEGGMSARIRSQKARFLQWRAILRGANASLNEVKVSYLPDNIAPEIISIQVLPPNIGLAPNPPAIVDPNLESAGIDPQVLGIPQQPIPPRRVFQRGAVALQWTAEDRNSDKLIYSIYYKEVSETLFKPLKENISENFYTIDGLSLADGNYVFKIIASDAPSNPPDKTLTGEKMTEVIKIDNTAPVVKVLSKSVTGNKAKIVFEAMDASSYIVRAEYSINGSDWKKIYPEDGISDGPRETYTLEVELNSPETSVTLRVFDLNGNTGVLKANLGK